jgi:putative spermidine/putrescine transport system permease protein
MMRTLSRTVACVMYVLLALPIIVVVASSFTSSHYIQFPPSGLTLRWYGEILSDDALT